MCITICSGLRKSQSFLPPGTHDLVKPLPLSVMGLPDRTWKMWCEVTPMIIWLRKTMTSVQLRVSLLCWFWWSKWPCWGNPPGKVLKVVSDWQPAKIEALSLTIHKKQMLAVTTWVWSTFMPSQALRWEPSPAWHFVLLQRTELAIPGPLTHRKCELINVSIYLKFYVEIIIDSLIVVWNTAERSSVPFAQFSLM